MLAKITTLLWNGLFFITQVWLVKSNHSVQWVILLCVGRGEYNAEAKKKNEKEFFFSLNFDFSELRLKTILPFQKGLRIHWKKRLIT